MLALFSSRKPSLFHLLAVLVLAGCGQESAERSPSVEGDPGPLEEVRPLQVYVVNYPLKYFTERIGGGEVDVVFPAPGDVDPASWFPSTETIAAFQETDLILLQGAGYERWVGRVSLPSSRLVDTSIAFSDRYIPLEGGTVHSHGPEGEHSHEETAFTTWLDPTLAIEHARAITDALVKARPEREDAFRQSFEALTSDLRDLDQRLSQVFHALGDEPLFFSHPVYQYLIQRYRLNGRSVHWEPNEVPDPGSWRKLEGQLAHHPARYMLWEQAPLPEIGEKLSALGLGSIVFDPCSNVPSEGDWLEVMHRNLGSLESAFSVARSDESGPG